MRVLIADGVFPGVEAVLRPLVTALDIDLLVATTPQEARTTLSKAELLILKNFPFGAAEIDTAIALRGVQKLGLLTERIDRVRLDRKGIPLRTLRLPSAVAVADHTLALLLALSRQLEPGRLAMGLPSPVQAITTDESHFAHNWAGLTTSSLAGQNLGLIGFGEVALEVTRRARAFGMRVRYTKRTPLPAVTERRLGVQFSPFEDLLKQSDVLSIHIPHTSETVGLIGTGQLAAMKPGALLINTARGAIVDETALVESLNSGRLGGAGLDVFAIEPLPHDSLLLTAPRLVLSPHVGGAGPDALAVAIANRLKRWRRTLADQS